MNKPTLPHSVLWQAMLPIIAAGVLVGCNSSSDDDDVDTGTQTVTVYYKANDTVTTLSADSTAYDNATLYIWNDSNCNAFAGDTSAASDWNQGLPADGVDPEFGAYWTLSYNQDSTQCINFIPRVDGNKVLGEYDGKIDLTQLGENDSAYTQQGVAAVYPELIPTSDLAANTTRIYFNSTDGDLDAFTLYVWNKEACTSFDDNETPWPGIAPTGFSSAYGAYWDLPTNDDNTCINIIATDKSIGDYQTADLSFDFAKQSVIGPIGFVFKGIDKVYYEPLTRLPQTQIALSGASAIFADASTLLVPSLDATSLSLYYSETGDLAFNSSSKTVTGFDDLITTSQAGSDDWKSSKPHLENDFKAFQFDFSTAQHDLKTMLKGQLWLVASDSSGVILATEVQPASALDALYADTASQLQYGAIVSGNTTSFRLWAPTAQSVDLVAYDADKQLKETIAMNWDNTSGSWYAAETALTHGDFYRYRVKVYHPATDQVEEYEVTDPYSHSLARNSEYSQVVNLDSSEVTPTGWGTLSAPHTQDNPSQFVLYEAHVRDFSSSDSSMAAQYRGKFAAFTQSDSVAVSHLKALADSGVTHLHLLPVFDIATINEDPDQVADIDQPFSKLCELQPTISADSDFGAYCSSSQTIADVFSALQSDDKQTQAVQRLNAFVRDVDSFNWGYDPFHYTVPEGSYASDPDGLARILEFRQMVMAIKQDVGLNVVMDVVYNHTNESGTSSKSVLDRIVPWYYQRLNEYSGSVENSTCCSNTAPENRMFAKLIDDSIATWVRDYKIDAFRWDLMGHHPLAQIQHTLQVAQAIDPQVYFYGEGWDFGEVATNRMFTQASQSNLGGTGIGSFSDRLRDAVRGGGPFDSQDALRSNQGFGNGIYVQPNDLASSDTLASALHLSDLVRLGMAGNLKAFTFIDSQDNTITGEELDYNGQAAGYAEDAWEIQNYVSKHDNQTLWDNNQYKIAYDAPVEMRVRMQAVSLASAMLGQGVPFIHMGSELLRSKSMQRDSYDSGDWFNRVDFSMQGNNWDVGLPRSDKDGDNWDIITQVITGAGEAANPGADNIAAMNRYFMEMAQLRASSGLLTLGKGSEIIKRVAFHNTGSTQIPGLIVMSINNSTDVFDSSIDAERSGLIVVLNASPTPVSNFAGVDASGYQLHSIQQQAGSDSIGFGASVDDGKLSVPAWSVAVFEAPITN